MHATSAFVVQLYVSILCHPIFARPRVNGSFNSIVGFGSKWYATVQAVRVFLYSLVKS